MSQDGCHVFLRPNHAGRSLPHRQPVWVVQMHSDRICCPVHEGNFFDVPEEVAVFVRQADHMSEGRHHHLPIRTAENLGDTKRA